LGIKTQRLVITTHFSVEAENTLLEFSKLQKNIPAILVQLPPGGEPANYQQRKQNFRKQLAGQGIEPKWLETRDINSPQGQALLEELNPSLLVTVGGRILKPHIIEIPQYGVVNLHGSVLPKYRNLGSEFWASYYNDLKHIGHTVHLIDPGIDTGPILARHDIQARPFDEMMTLRMRNAQSGGGNLARAVAKLDEDQVEPIPQDDANSLFFNMPSGVDQQRDLFRRKLRAEVAQRLSYPGQASLGIGLAELSYGWMRVLEQEGLYFEVFQVSPALTPAHYALLIINRRLEVEERRAVASYVDQGGAVLGSAEHLKFLLEGHGVGSTHYESIMVQPPNQAWQERVDVHAKGYELNGAKREDWGGWSVAKGGGLVLALPFDVEILLRDTRVASVPSHAGPQDQVTTNLSQVNKGGVRRVITLAMRKAYLHRGYPYIHISYYPAPYQGAFAFRIDSDGYESESFETTFQTAHQLGIKMTWVIDVCSQLNQLDHAVKIAQAGQDVHAHCFEHEVFDSFDHNLANMAQAKQHLKKVGINSRAIFAPFGKWNPGFNRAMEKLAVEYSSEFTVAYDDLPYHPLVNQKRLSKVVQVPIHPYCLGDMMKCGFKMQQVVEHFDREILKKFRQNEPLFFYGHPIGRLGTYPQVLEHIIKRAKSLPNIWFTNLTEFYDHWMRRRQLLLAPIMDRGQVILRTFSPGQPVPAHVIMPDGREIINVVNPG
jgi:folate-dependent phosphoribosylglycinamide formyltransferase PurN